MKHVLDCYNALMQDPTKDKYWNQFVDAIQFVEFTQDDPILKGIILKCFSKNFLNYQQLAIPGYSLIQHSKNYQLILAKLDDNDLWEIFLNSKLYYEPLLIALINHTIIPNQDFEKFITVIRKQILFNRNALPKEISEFIEAIANHCYLTEYIYDETTEETKLVETIDSTYSSIHEMYRPWHKEEYFEDEINSLAVITDETSRKVREQYEENPYPRWQSPIRKQPQSFAKYIMHLFPYLSIAEIEEPKILIAGCGTGQHAINTALKYENCQVLAVDLSLTALGYALKKARQFRISNIEFLHADILDLHNLNSAFDVIECIGVLHHMKNPLNGWNVLINLLNEGGFLNIGLYSQKAREDVTAARKFIAQYHFKPDAYGIKKCRKHIFQLPDDHTAKSLINSLDFYTVSSCRDLMFHVQEHQFNLSQIHEMIEKSPLSFLGFDLIDQSTLEQYQLMFPDDLNAINLNNWEMFETKYPSTFINMYQFWLQKN